MKLIAEKSVAEAWLGAAQHLESCDNWEDYNVILEIGSPMRRNARDRRIEDQLDTFLRAARQAPLSTVSDTIFPSSEYRRHGPKGVYDTYPDDIYPRIKPLPELSWGTYAYRLVRRKGPKGVINPLERCVDKINQELRGKSTKTACYELSLTDIDVDLPIYEPGKDCNRHRGGPCLSHISIKVGRKKTLALTALYRSHHYVKKALGNLLGLARLQAFICEQTGLESGSLVCISSYATLERTGSSLTKSAISKILDELGEGVSDAVPGSPRLRPHVGQ